MYVLTRNLGVTLITVILALACTYPAVGQTTWCVDDDAPNDPGPGDPNNGDAVEGGSLEYPFDTIQEAIDAAHDGDTVWLGNGVYAGPGNRDLDFHGKAIVVRSISGNPKACIIDCQGTGPDPHCGFYLHSGEAETSVIEGLTITNGHATYGGAVSCEDGSSPTLTNCIFSGNQAAFGGGVSCYYSCSPRLINCTISGNRVFWAHGGGVYCVGDSSPTLTNCTISGNSADLSGGGVFCEHLSSPTPTDYTTSGNSADSCGGGADCEFSPSATLTNCILWGDTPQEIAGSPAVTYSDVQGGWSGTGNIDADPLFVNSDSGDCRLSSGSPCIDAGCNGGMPRDTGDLDDDGDTNEITPLDLDGEGRFFDDPNTADTGCGFSAIVDMGTYEFGGSGPQPCPGDMDGDRDVDQSDLGILLAAWGDTDTCDLDCDGDIDQADLGILLANWGNECP
jgi:parallel beta-helix repeat protein